MTYAHTSSIKGHEHIRVHYYDDKEWYKMDIHTLGFDDQDKQMYKDLDLVEFGKYYVERHGLLVKSKA